MKNSGFALLLLGLILSISARAQITINPVQDYINKTTILNNILSNKRAVEMSQKTQTNGKTGGSGKAGGANSAKAGPVADPTLFNRAASGYLMPARLAGASGGDAAKQRESEKFFASLLGLYEQTAKKDGFPANDLAYAMEYFIVNMYLTYHDLHDVPYEKDPRVKRGKDMFDRLTIINEKKLLMVSPYQERAVYNQIKGLLSQNPDIQKLTDQQKQEVTEVLAIMFGINYTAYMKGVNAEDARMIEQAHQSAKSHLEQLLGKPIGQIKIGNNGLE